ncbi:ABC transporter ATP-binding protein [Actinomadura gamaensis]|uniref:ATP-binding cassette domain-containing protein n=1 Tax=Actinomadura gamaensis TaxID=1763541 RepID=A0ABV9TU27_9ACTN
MDSVAFRYGRRGPWVLRDISLTLRPGDIAELTGPNGAGKSTLLRLLAGLHRPRRGTIVERPASVGYAPERFPTDQPFTVTAYLAHMSALHGLPKTASTHWTHLLNLDHLLDTPLPDLSKGSAQKVGLIQALLPSPRLLLLDEPFSGLDATTLALLPELLAAIAAKGTMIVLSDHHRVLHHPEAAAHLPSLRHLHLSDSVLTEHTTSPASPDAPLTEAPATPPRTPPRQAPSSHRENTPSPDSPAVRLKRRFANNTGNASDGTSNKSAASSPNSHTDTRAHEPTRSPADSRADNGAHERPQGRADNATHSPADGRTNNPQHSRADNPQHGGADGQAHDRVEKPPHGLADGGLHRPSTVSRRGASPAEIPPDCVLLEVIVRADEADDVERQLRAAGRTVRRGVSE